jgi:hypothetical protein
MVIAFKKFFLYYFPLWLYNFTFTSIVHKCFNCFMSVSTLTICVYICVHMFTHIYIYDVYMSIILTGIKCDSDLCILDDWWHWPPLHMHGDHLYTIFTKVSIHVLCPFFFSYLFLLFCWVGVNCGIYKSSYNISF